MITQLINKLFYRKKSIYTKEQRYNSYNKALGNLKLLKCRHRSLCSSGLCLLFYGENIQDYPEIIKHKPIFKSFGNYWWKMDEKGYNKRVKILQEAIKLTTD